MLCCDGIGISIEFPIDHFISREPTMECSGLVLKMFSLSLTASISARSVKLSKLGPTGMGGGPREVFVNGAKTGRNAM